MNSIRKLRALELAKQPHLQLGELACTRGRVENPLVSRRIWAWLSRSRARARLRLRSKCTVSRARERERERERGIACRVTIWFIPRRNRRRALWPPAERSARLGPTSLSFRFLGRDSRRAAMGVATTRGWAQFAWAEIAIPSFDAARVYGDVAVKFAEIILSGKTDRPIGDCHTHAPFLRPPARRWREIYARAPHARPSRRISSGVNSVNRKNWRRSLSSDSAETYVTCRKYSRMFREIGFPARANASRGPSRVETGNTDIDFTMSTFSITLLRRVIE